MCKYRVEDSECVYSAFCVHQTQGPNYPICGERDAKGPNKDEFGFDLCGFCGNVWQPVSASHLDFECAYCGAS